MADKKNTQQYDYFVKQFFEVLNRQQFSEVLRFLQNHGGLDAVDEHRCTALIELVLRPCSLSAGVHNDFAKKLVELGCDINKKDGYGNTALYYAARDKNIDMVHYLLNCDGIEMNSVSLPLDDEVMELFVRAGCDIFNRDPKIPEGSFETCLALHQGKSQFWIGYDSWKDFHKTLQAVCELYPERLDKVPDFYLDTVAYDFLIRDFFAPGSNHLAGKKAITSYVHSLPRGVESTDERGRNLISCCALFYQSAHSMYRNGANERRALRCIRYLADMGVSLHQPDFQGKPPIAYLREVGIGGLADELLEKQQK